MGNLIRKFATWLSLPTVGHSFTIIFVPRDMLSPDKLVAGELWLLLAGLLLFFMEMEKSQLTTKLLSRHSLFIMSRKVVAPHHSS